MAAMADMSKLQEILEMGEHEPRSYSGRAMYGRSCLGVECSDVGELFAEVLESADEDDLRELAETFRTMRTDSMGLDIIVYFPGTEYVRNDADCEECDATVKIGEKLCRECQAESLPAT